PPRWTEAALHAAVDPERAAGHERRLVRGEIERGRRDLLRVALTADRLPLREGLEHPVEAAHPRGETMGDRRVDPAGADAVATDPLRGVVERNGLRQHQHPALRRDV